MLDNEQSGTLAFLQNFYTGTTLYLPRATGETAAHEPAPVVSAVPLPAPAVAPAIAPQIAPVPAQPAAGTPPLTPLPPAPPARLPSLASTALPSAPAPAAEPASPAAPPVAPYLLTTFDTLGSNAQGVVLLVRLPPAQFVKLPRNVFLNKLLQAIGLVMADVVLVNVDGPYPVALQNLRKEIAATHILAFGKNLLDVAVRTTQIYEPVQFPAVGLAYLAGAEVELIEYDVSLKKRLWAGLQRMFSK